jgi:MFS family permease
MKLENRRWIILAVNCLINMCIGSLYAWSVFSSPLAKHFNELNGYSGSAILTAVSLSIVFTFANGVGPITMIFGGSINDKLGPRWVVFIGGLLFGLGMFFAGSATSILSLILTYGLGCGFGMGLVYGCTVNNSVKLFPDKRGLIGGIVTATFGLSSVIVAPLAQKLIAVSSVSTALRIFGLVFMVIICGGSFLVEKCPEGWVPEGYKAKKTNNNIIVNKNYKEMTKDINFYLMITMLMCGAFSGLMIISQASPMAQKVVNTSATTAAICVSILSLFNVGGRVLAGLLSDKIGSVNTLTLTYVIAITGMIILTRCSEGTLIMFTVGFALVGLCFGSIMGVFPGFTANQFGPKNNSMNYGIMFIGFALAGLFGPNIASNIVLKTNSYNNAFLLAMGLSLLGIVLTFVYRKLNVNN